MPPAARVTDMHVCPKVEPGPVPHVGGPILPAGEPTVLIGFMPAARQGDMAVCVGPPDGIAMGEPTVLIGNAAAARMGDSMNHGGSIVLGCPTVLIGSSAQGQTMATNKPFCEACEGQARRRRVTAGAPADALPRAVVEIRFGPLRGTKATIAPGQRLSVGRTERADLMVPHDLGIAAVHFHVAWDGSTCRVESLRAEAYADLRTTLENAGLTLVNGERVDAGTVKNGDWIKAGNTVVMVYVEGTTPPRPEKPGHGAPAPVRHQALAALQAEPAPLFAVLDAARDRRVLELLRESVEEHRSLYEGVKGEAMGEEAPYLVALPHGSRLLQRLVLEGWGKRWGIYLTSKRPADEVRTHFRRVTMVTDDETEQRLYFRFLDRRVLSGFLPDATPRPGQLLLGVIDSFLLEGDQGALERHRAAG